VCHQHARFVREALQSVINQTYSNIELIVVDDGSTDGSAAIIQQFKARHPSVRTVFHPQPSGYCVSFNAGWRLATGEYIIDLAGDDVLLPERVEKGVAAFLKADRPGIQFSDALYINESGEVLSRHSDRFPHHQVPQGFIFSEVLRRYFICSPTMMISQSVLVALGGYDEALVYEDFDLWVRAARDFPFHYVPEVLVKKRLLKDSMSVRQLNRAEHYNATTLAVCRKALALASTRSERSAVRYRIAYEAYQHGKRLQVSSALRYAALWWQTWLFPIFGNL
jgi:glycosyltransferase involved in cell wall biosynthesis